MPVRAEEVGGALNREAWLASLVDKLRPWFAAAGITYPDLIHISVGWPNSGGTRKKKPVIGQCWTGVSEDGNPHIFISPKLAQAEAMATTVHELVHASGLSGHGPAFARANTAVGMVGKPTQSDTAGPELTAELERIATELGPYPHVVLSPTPKEKVQGTRMLKLQCIKHSDYILRASKKVIDLGLPVCGMCQLEYLEAEGSEFAPLSMQEAA